MPTRRTSGGSSEIAARLRARHHRLSVSAEVLPEIKEYERTSTTVINAYVRPVVGRYLTGSARGLGGAGVAAPLLLMQSNGGLMTARGGRRDADAHHRIGPGRRRGRRAGAGAPHRHRQGDLASTWAAPPPRPSLIENGEVTRAAEYQVGGGIMLGSRLLSGAGYTLKVPAIDLAEVGAGGGSILWIDGGGALQVGPHSAGASPGPVCYGQGGAEPTVTDANVVLGYLNPRASGRRRGAARRRHARAAAIAERVAGPLGMSSRRRRTARI